MEVQRTGAKYATSHNKLIGLEARNICHLREPQSSVSTGFSNSPTRFYKNPKTPQ
uniref:Uncharacterized protein n=1 Tax=Arundo donax TaxID=35708 RepID=A0A0A9MR29_ARUDO